MGLHRDLELWSKFLEGGYRRALSLESKFLEGGYRRALSLESKFLEGGYRGDSIYGSITGVIWVLGVVTIAALTLNPSPSDFPYSGFRV